MDSFGVLQKTIERCLSIRCRNYKEDYIRRRILSRMRVTQAKDYNDYRHILLSSDREKEELRDALTINVTRFFRDREVFESIGRDLIPEILSRKPRIRIWCAGCSSGEEPYTLAILLKEYMERHPERSGIIYATDIDLRVLQKAREGVYSGEALGEVTPPRLRAHFVPLGDGKYRVNDTLRALVRFKHHDLMSGIPVSHHLDLVTCRNVAIYFDERQKRDLIRLFHLALADGGYYVMGKTEFLDDISHRYFSFVDANEKILRKIPMRPSS